MNASYRISLDLNALCNVITGREGFSGISRVIHELAIALVRESEESEFDIEFGMSGYPQFIPVMERYFEQVGLSATFVQPSPLAREFYRFFVDRTLYPYRGQFLAKCMAPLYNGSEQIDLIHSPYWHVRRGRTCSAPLVVTVHDLIAMRYPQYFESDKGSMARKHLNAVAREAQHFICVSENTRRDLCAHYDIHEERTSVVPLAASSAMFHPVTSKEAVESVRNRYGIPGSRYLLSLATIEPRKNISGIIDAFLRYLAQSDDPDVCLVIAGASGWLLQEAIGNRVGDSALKGRIIKTGFVDDGDIAALYSGAEAFLYLSHYEGFGLPPLEAMQCGTPVICSSTSSLPEVVSDAGLLVDPTDAAAACDAIARVLTDDRERFRMKRAGLEQSRKFTWRETARATLNVYRGVLRTALTIRG